MIFPMNVQWTPLVWTVMVHTYVDVLLDFVSMEKTAQVCGHFIHEIDIPDYKLLLNLSKSNIT